MEQKWIKEMGRSAISIFGMRLVGMITLVVVALTYVTAHELAMCKLADENGVLGMVVAVPRFDLCFYMMSLRDHEEKKRSGDIYTATDTWMNEEYSASEQSTDPNVRRSWPCIQQYFHKTTTTHRVPLGGVESLYSVRKPIGFIGL